MALIIVAKPLPEHITELYLQGELDLDSGPILSKKIQELMATRRRSLIIDLEKLTFIDMAGLNALVAAYQEVKNREGALSFVNPCDLQMKVFHLTGLDKSDKFRMRDDEKQAREALAVLSSDCRQCAVFGMPFCALIKGFAYPARPCNDPKVRLPWFANNTA